MSRARRASRRAARAWCLALSLVALVGCSDDDDATPPVPGIVDAGGRLVDPLSMPETPTHSVEDFAGAEACGGCHETHHAEWSKSMHAYAMVDPVFRALVRVRQEDFEGAQDAFCVQCHSAIATRGGEIVPGFDFDDLSDVSLEGVTCEACHKVSEVARNYNSGHRLDPDGPIRGPIEDPVDNGFHDSEFSETFLGAELCSGCHDVVEVSGVNLERPYQEWRQSPAADDGRPCQSCHMPTYTGRATPESPERDELHSHRFVGVDVPLADGFVSDAERELLRESVRQLIEGCASVRLSAPAGVRAGDRLDLLVTIDNEIDAHNFPTGSTFIRQAWLEVIATDAAGEVLYRTGTLDDNGDLRDVFSELDTYGDPDLIAFHSSLVDGLGAPEIFPWRAAEHFARSIPPAYARTFTLFVPTDAAAEGPLSIEARLRFRTHAPHLLRKLGLSELVDEIEIYDVAGDAIAVDVSLGLSDDAG